MASGEITVRVVFDDRIVNALKVMHRTVWWAAHGVWWTRRGPSDSTDR